MNLLLLCREKWPLNWKKIRLSNFVSCFHRSSTSILSMSENVETTIISLWTLRYTLKCAEFAHYVGMYIVYLSILISSVRHVYSIQLAINSKHNLRTNHRFCSLCQGKTSIYIINVIVSVRVNGIVWNCALLPSPKCFVM